jgi:ATP-binding cassette subfamily C protein
VATNAYVTLVKVMTAAITTVVQLSVAFMISWPVALAGCFLGGVIALMSWRLVRLSRVMGQRRTNGVQMLTTRLLEAIGGMKALKGMGVEDRMEPLLGWEIGNIRSATRNLNILNQALRVIPEPIAAVFIGISLLIYLQFIGGQLEAFLVLALLMSRSMQSIGQMQRSYQSVISNEPSFWFVENLIRDARAHEERLHGSETPTLNEEIRFSRVSFGYNGRDVLRHVDMAIGAGKITALTGLSGAGKTTLVDLVAGLQEPDLGVVTIDGIPLPDIDMQRWRSKIGYVLQETFLFHESIANNVTLGDPSLGKVEAEAALRKAGAWDFVAASPEGLDTTVGERGSRLSGGQRQRIAIARALVRNPTLLILDEPTVGLDHDTELGICQSLANLAGEVTILAVSHQPALLGIADRVYEVFDGSVREYSPPRINDPAPAPRRAAELDAATRGV